MREDVGGVRWHTLDKEIEHCGRSGRVGFGMLDEEVEHPGGSSGMGFLMRVEAR